jgi:hypothetical protein
VPAAPGQSRATLSMNEILEKAVVALTPSQVTYIHAYTHTCMHAYIHAYTHMNEILEKAVVALTPSQVTYMHTHTHACIHTRTWKKPLHRR